MVKQDPAFNIIRLSGSVRRSDLDKKALQMEDLRHQKRQCESYEESPNIANPFHVLKTSTEMRFATDQGWVNLRVRCFRPCLTVTNGYELGNNKTSNTKKIAHVLVSPNLIRITLTWKFKGKY